MRPFLISCFIFGSLLLGSCSRPYKNLILNKQQTSSINFAPKFDNELYRCVVYGKFVFKKFHLTGLLYFKNLSDTATRVVFQNEMGITYFDFGWDKNDSFQINYIIDQMNKPALIRILKKDFELLLFKINNSKPVVYQNKENDFIYRYGLSKGYAYYILNTNKELSSIENSDEKRKIILIKFYPSERDYTLSDEITIKHLRAHFTITLKKLNQDVVE